MQIQVLPPGFSQLPCRIYFLSYLLNHSAQLFFFRHSEIFLARQHYVLVNNVKIIMKIPRNCTWGKCTAADLGYCVPYLTTHKYSGNIYSVVRRNLNKEYVQRVKEQESRDQPNSFIQNLRFVIMPFFD